jgi:hypothetical protein
MTVMAAAMKKFRRGPRMGRDQSIRMDSSKGRPGILLSRSRKTPVQHFPCSPCLNDGRTESNLSAHLNLTNACGFEYGA